VSGVLVIAEHRQGVLRPPTFELIAAAQGLRAGTDGEVAVAVIGASPEQHVLGLSSAGVDEIVTVAVAAEEFEPDTVEAAVGALIAARRPHVVLVLHSVDSMGYAAALAARGGFGFATDVFRLEYQGAELVATRGGYGQKVCIEVDFPGKATVVVALRASVFKPLEGIASPRVSAFAAPAVTPRSQSLAFIPVSSADDVDLSTAEFILSIGRGIGEESNVATFRELAEAVGATLGCSRPVADSGWLPKSRQVGQSGRTAAACKLYLAMGISGAIQHQAGMKHVATVIAVNTDAEASIFSVARYGVVADVFEIAAALRTHF
jgi:electron transfer flavoprotein alpha subunit